MYDHETKNHSEDKMKDIRNLKYVIKFSFELIDEL